jgi:large subunit ribosomal protein L18
MENKKELLRVKRHKRLMLRIRGTAERPRLMVHRSLSNMQAQMIDDTAHKTLFSLSTLDKEIKQKFPRPGNIKAAEFFGEVFARRAKEKGFSEIIFDRAGYLYHGRIKAFADNLRKGGLKF